jgi:hypothetical protein
MCLVGRVALGQWGDDIVRSEPLSGGAGVDEVWRVRINGHLAVGRLGQRSGRRLRDGLHAQANTGVSGQPYQGFSGTARRVARVK